MFKKKETSTLPSSKFFWVEIRRIEMQLRLRTYEPKSKNSINRPKAMMKSQSGKRFHFEQDQQREIFINRFIILIICKTTFYKCELITFTNLSLKLLFFKCNCRLMVGWEASNLSAWVRFPAVASFFFY